MEATVDVMNARVVREPDGIIAVLWNRGVDVEVADIESVLDAEYSLLDDAQATVLVDARPVRSMSRAAQRLTTEHDISDRTAAVAIVIQGPVSRMLGNFFMSITRPKYPTRLFTDEAAARDWLRVHRG